MIDAYMIEERKRQRERAQWEPFPLQIEPPSGFPQEQKEKEEGQEKEEWKPSVIVIDL